MAFTCPRCGRATVSPDDEREGYCGACRDWTGPWTYLGRTDSDLWYLGFGQELAGQVARAVAAHACGLISLDELREQVRGQLDEAAAALVTSWRQSPGTDCGDCPSPGDERQPEVDDIPWSSPMEWSPGDAEL